MLAQSHSQLVYEGDEASIDSYISRLIEEQVIIESP